MQESLGQMNMERSFPAQTLFSGPIIHLYILYRLALYGRRCHWPQALSWQRSLLMLKNTGRNSSLGAPFTTQQDTRSPGGKNPVTRRWSHPATSPGTGELQGTRSKREPGGAWPGNGPWKAKLLICWFSKLTYQ